MWANCYSAENKLHGRGIDRAGRWERGGQNKNTQVVQPLEPDSGTRSPNGEPKRCSTRGWLQDVRFLGLPLEDADALKGYAARCTGRHLLSPWVSPKPTKFCPEIFSEESIVLFGIPWQLVGFFSPPASLDPWRQVYPETWLYFCLSHH